MTSIIYGATYKVVGPIATDSFSYSITENPYTVTTRQYTSTLNDVLTTYTDTGGTDNNFSISVTQGVTCPGYSISSKTPAICSVTSSGVVTRQTDGVAIIEISNAKGKVTYSRNLQYTGGSTTSTTSYIEGSLAKHIENNINNMINGKSPGPATQNTYSTNNGNVNSPSVVRNPNLFCSAYNISHMSTMTTLGSQFPIALISPRHIIKAHHTDTSYTMTKVCFLDKNGTYQTANVVSHLFINNIDPLNQDTEVLYLDRDIDVMACPPAKVLPSNFASYLPSFGTVNIPVISKGYTRGDYLRLQYYKYTAASKQLILSSSYPNSWFESIIAGDSSGLLWVPIQNDMVLLNCIYTNVNQDNYASFISSIETAMNTLAAAQGDNRAFSLSKVDLSAFTKYS
ncbi:MAG TPA: hypothetical protein VFM18_04760 [Methanosarcina sp.]|nr:hypothetical protein [Methanosarcina sp.]